MAGPTEQQDEDKSFGALLDQLVRLKKHDDGRPYKVSEIADEIGISKGHFYALIKGSHEPSLRVAQQTAAYFGVELEYFGTGERAREIQNQYALLARLSEEGIRDIAFRASALSPEVLPSVLDFIEFQASRSGGNNTSG